MIKTIQTHTSSEDY